MQIRGVNSFLWGASSNAARRHCPAAPSILTKSGGDNCPPPFIDAPVSKSSFQSTKEPVFSVAKPKKLLRTNGSWVFQRAEKEIGMYYILLPQSMAEAI